MESGFHELVREWMRAFVYSGRPTAVQAIVCLAFMACNVQATYLYGSLGTDPRRPFGDVRLDLSTSLAKFGRRARAAPP